MKAGSYILKLPAVIAVLFHLNCCIARNDSAVVEIDPSGWNSSDRRQAAYYNSDTLSLRTMDILVVYDELFRRGSSPFTISVTTVSPDSVSISENITICPGQREIAPVTGYMQSTFTYRKDVRLSQKGDYTFIFTHGSPIPVEGIKALGIIISDESNLER